MLTSHYWNQLSPALNNQSTNTSTASWFNQFHQKKSHTGVQREGRETKPGRTLVIFSLLDTSCRTLQFWIISYSLKFTLCIGTTPGCGPCHERSAPDTIRDGLVAHKVPTVVAEWFEFLNHLQVSISKVWHNKHITGYLCTDAPTAGILVTKSTATES
jgi:hypothetical protein